MLQQPVRVGGLALACALATSFLVLVTFLASNLVLSAVGVLGLGAPAQPAPPPPSTAVLLSAERDDEEGRCERARSSERRAEREADRQQARVAERCAEQRKGTATRRP